MVVLGAEDSRIITLFVPPGKSTAWGVCNGDDRSQAGFPLILTGWYPPGPVCFGRAVGQLLCLDFLGSGVPLKIFPRWHEPRICFHNQYLPKWHDFSGFELTVGPMQ